MSVKDVLILAARLLERNELSEEIARGGSALSAEAETLLSCYNLVEHEVALDHFPLKKRERFAVEGGRLPYTAFSLTPVKIHSVEDGCGRTLKCSVFPDSLHLPEDCTEAVVVYAYSPADKTLTQETEFGDRISKRLLAYGVASEYCLTAHRFEEGKIWGERYRDALQAAGILHRPLSMRSRRWI